MVEFTRPVSNIQYLIIQKIIQYLSIQKVIQYLLSNI